MIRASFRVDSDRAKPAVWPLKHPYWIADSSGRDTVIVAYADDKDELRRVWPGAGDICATDVSAYEFSGRFPPPEWWRCVESPAHASDPTTRASLRDDAIWRRAMERLDERAGVGGERWPNERPAWCPHTDCAFRRRAQDAACVGELPEPAPHNGDLNTFRLCMRDTDNGQVVDWQINRSDLWHMRRLFDALDGRDSASAR